MGTANSSLPFLLDKQARLKNLRYTQWQIEFKRPSSLILIKRRLITIQSRQESTLLFTFNTHELN